MTKGHSVLAVPLATGLSIRAWQDPRQVKAGIVGMGLMGTSIVTCLLAAGHSVRAVEINRDRRKRAHGQVLSLLQDLQREGLLKPKPEKLLKRLTVSGDYAVLRESHIVLEAVVEDIDLKKQVLSKIEEAVSPGTLIGSNTSAIPPSELQKGALRPGRIMGIHWAEPAHITRFMEIICGNDTSPVCAERVLILARQWGKEPSLLRKDVRGFITNRIMYAMLREAFHLVESGVASIADVDRSLRNDLGYWITFAGPFRFMDLTGIPAYAAVMKDLLPDLSCKPVVPSLMSEVVRSGARGISNGRGFYKYTPAEARRWEKLFIKFSYEIRGLAQKYPEKIESSVVRGRLKSVKGETKRPDSIR